MISSLKTKMDIFVPFYAFIRINWWDRPRMSWWRHSGAWEQQELVKTLPGCSSTHLKGDFRCHGEPMRDDRFLLSRSSFPHVQLHAAASGQKNLPVHLHRGAACQLARWNTENKKTLRWVEVQSYAPHCQLFKKILLCWMTQSKGCKQRVVGLSVTLKNYNCSQSGALCFPTSPECVVIYLLCCSNQLWTEWINIYRLCQQQSPHTCRVLDFFIVVSSGKKCWLHQSLNAK